MGIGPQNLGAAGMSTKSKPCGTPLKMSEDSPLAFNEKLEAAVDSGKITGKFAEAIKKESPAKKLESAKMEFGETDSDAKDKYKSTGINEKLNEIQ